MEGKFNIKIQNKRVKYEFILQCNITVLRGDSATGKTTLIEMISEYEQEGVNSGIQLTCAKKCKVLNGNNWEAVLKSLSDCIVFIDEGNKFITSEEFASAIKHTDNYYVIVTRENLPYSVGELYATGNTNKYGSLKQVCSTFSDSYSDKSIMAF